MKEKIVLAPQKGPQEMFLATSADICIYGGAAGGGKTFGLLLEPLRYMNNPDYNATIFRRDYTQVSNRRSRTSHRSLRQPQEAMETTKAKKSPTMWWKPLKGD